MTMSPKNAYRRLMSGAPMKIGDVLAALKHAGGFSCAQSKKKQSHYKISRSGVSYPFILPAKHDGEVKRTWLRDMIHHFDLGENEQEAD